MIPDFLWYVEKGKVKKTQSNIARARALIKTALGRLQRISNRKDIYDFEDVYESLKEVLQAFMEAEGYHPYSHEAIVAFAKDNMKLGEKTVNKLDKMRRMRHDFVYRGAEVNPETVKELVDFGIELIEKLVREIRKKFEL